MAVAHFPLISAFLGLCFFSSNLLNYVMIWGGLVNFAKTTYGRIITNCVKVKSHHAYYKTGQTSIKRALSRLFQNTPDHITKR